VVEIRDLSHFGSAVQAPVAARVIPGQTNISSYLKRFFDKFYKILTLTNYWNSGDFSIERLFFILCEDRRPFGCNVPEMDSISLEDFEYLLLTDFKDLFVRGPRGVIRGTPQPPSNTTTTT